MQLSFSQSNTVPWLPYLTYPGIFRILLGILTSFFLFFLPTLQFLFAVCLHSHGQVMTSQGPSPTDHFSAVSVLQSSIMKQIQFSHKAARLYRRQRCHSALLTRCQITSSDWISSV